MRSPFISNVSFRKSFKRWPIYISNSADKTKLPFLVSSLYASKSSKPLKQVIQTDVGFAFQRSVIGPENSPHSLNVISCKTRTNRDLAIRVFPALPNQQTHQTIFWELKASTRDDFSSNLIIWCL